MTAFHLPSLLHLCVTLLALALLPLPARAAQLQLGATYAFGVNGSGEWDSVTQVQNKTHRR